MRFTPLFALVSAGHNEGLIGAQLEKEPHALAREWNKVSFAAPRL